MIEIIPSILTNDPKELIKKLGICEGVVERVQIDIIDGVYASNKTIDPSALSTLETELKLDFHLMVKEPVNWIEKCVGAGADRIIAQIEYMRDQVEFVGKVQEVGAGVGLAVDLKTEIDKLDPVILTNLDVVLVMSVPAGFGGQKFDERALDKIKRLDEIRARDKTPYRICDDGGVVFEWVDDIRREGVDEVVIGRSLFEGRLKDNIKKYRNAAYK
jgi:ribulose-phosphate 3-epimerase